MSDFESLFWLGPPSAHVFTPADSNVMPSSEAQRLIREHLRSIRPLPDDNEPQIDRAFFSELNRLDGIYMLPEIISSGIFSLADVHTLAYCSFNRKYVSVLRATLGMDESDSNWDALRRLMNYFAGVNNIYYDHHGFDTCKRSRARGLAEASRWLKTVNLAGITLDYYTTQSVCTQAWISDYADEQADEDSDEEESDS
ncbi:hypothetical protein BDZ89DRAFT_1050449 [Hymenopellis radicata]|nr:hypothetical protein BDZ89DRAFT_1050449 [Hymenopellis radicata]